MGQGRSKIVRGVAAIPSQSWLEGWVVIRGGGMRGWGGSGAARNNLLCGILSESLLHTVVSARQGVIMTLWSSVLFNSERIVASSLVVGPGTFQVFMCQNPGFGILDFKFQVASVRVFRVFRVGCHV